jgi:NAD(P)-dependent dehydrogenase (short-subunit alcohol dehydrogenase family)
VPPHETYAYSASKAALHHLSRNMAGRLGYEGITSNTIACGPFATKSASLPSSPCLLHSRNAYADRLIKVMAHTLKTEGKRLVATIPLQRIGNEEDVAGTALFLSSNAGKYVNGATITLDGGSVVNMPKQAHLPVKAKAKL